MPICKFCNDTKKVLLLFTEVECLDCSNIDERIAKQVIWKLPEAVELLRQIEALIKPIKYTSALGGGVLFKGESTKDLDIFIAPYNKTDVDHEKLIEILKRMGFKQVKTKDQVHKGFEYCGDGSKEHKHVEIWDYFGRRVDFFFVS